MPAESPASRRLSWLAAGLFLITLSTLMLEVLDTRLLSVITWYHLSFLAVSVAMLGMAAGAVIVFAGQDLFSKARAVRMLPLTALAFAASIALSHAGNLSIPFPTLHLGSPTELVALGMAILVLTVPFILSGIVVTLALTRTGGPIGWLYGADLIGAAMGCLVIILLLEFTDITSTAFAAAGIAALGAWCFSKHAGSSGWGALALGMLLLVATAVNAVALPRLGILYPKSRSLWGAVDAIDYSEWNAHSNVIIRRPTSATPFYWGAAANAPQPQVKTATAAIDGDAGTVITEWDGDPSSLDWVRYDVTTLPYRLRSGNVAVIGVGGGRDILSAIQAGNTDVTGIEINGALIDAHRGRYREFSRIAAHPGVTLVHDEARSYLTRTPGRFDILQMSLIDTWAATGAGAFTLSENGLYTREGWRVFLRALTSDGVFSVSRWFDPNAASETTRLLALGAAALLDAGIADPRQHIILVTRERIATLMVSPSPFTAGDADAISRTTSGMDFSVLAAPWQVPSDPRVRRIIESRSMEALEAATLDRYFDFSPPSDRRPFFFNMLKPTAFFVRETSGSAGVVSGNLRATRTLIALAVIAAVLVVAIIGSPLLLTGRPRTPPGIFGAGLLYFGIIGFAFMLIQIPFLQRFSVYLGHPTYTFSIILFLMILSAGVGSVASERVDVVRSSRLGWLPIAIGLSVLVTMALLQPAIDATVAWRLPGRTAIVALFVAPLAFCLGYCFPVGMRALGQHSDALTAWMWAVNGACGVMASIIAVMISMWIGIHTNLLVAALLYMLLALPLRALRRHPAIEKGRNFVAPS